MAVCGERGEKGLRGVRREMAVLRSVRIVVAAERRVVSEGDGSNALSVEGGEVASETRR